MTTRELAILRALVNYLHTLDGRQADEIMIHAAVYHATDPAPGLKELLAALREADARGWVTGVPGRYTGKTKFNLTDAGEAARLELNE